MNENKTGTVVLEILPGAAISLAKPKSQSFTTPNFETKTFSGLTSRCMICKKSQPDCTIKT